MYFSGFSSKTDGVILIESEACLFSMIMGGKTSPPNPCPNTFGIIANENIMQITVIEAKIFKIVLLRISAIKIS
ncbi:hypothetical protein NZNM25_16360 [Nitrosopumilus zosterae]|uniref:Uncharacterized protein n=1 Tax=Nitrosopumilus zosterae TaxID=718286 RepID=A0A2S2KTQ4_9ARCH|nr:hypothetical protein NZNM25_16360 [Nitrosopumilus zosterae]